MKAPLGAGGMGEVYRATDTKLGRDVAIKLLPEAFAADPERLARFEREAHILARLNHRNIAAIHGLEEADGKPFLVLELVEGEDLAARLKRGALPVEEALEVARQIAAALEEAHERGIVHRDLKPANVKLTPDGTVKVLDFGLARAYAGGTGAEPSAELSQSPTLAHTPTQAGVILGTAAYMSPEQARGKPLDKRADIWAFGVVLFEMLTGKRLFRGETTSDTLAAVLRADPDWGGLPTGTPPRIRELLSRCLTRDPRGRLRDIGDARIELERGDAAPATVASHSGRKARWLSGALGLAAGAAVVWMVSPGARREETTKAPLVRLSVTLPSDAPFWLDTFPNRGLAISRDGRQLAYVKGTRIGDASRQICVRRLDDLTIRPIPGTEGAYNPFFSPDGTWIAFSSPDGMIKKVSLAGGRPVALLRDLSASLWRLGSWSDDGRIVFDAPDGLRVVPANGGTATALTTGEGYPRDPVVLPESDLVLFSTEEAHQAQVEAMTLDGRRRKTVLDNASHALYLASGHLLFFRDGGLMLAPFDRDRVEVTGPAVSVPLEVALDHPNQSTPLPQLAVSLEGTLVYVPILPGSQRSSTLVWVDRRGTVEEAGTVSFAAPHFSLAPDGGRIAVTGRDGGKAYLDLYDLSRRTASRFMERELNRYPNAALFSADGQRLLFGRWGAGRWGADESELWWQPVDGGAAPERALTVPGVQLSPSSISRDGRFVTLTVFGAESLQDVWVGDLEARAEPRARAFVATKDYEYGAAFAPDGHSIAYTAGGDSVDENIYVRRFPEGDRKVRVSVEGGVGAQWSHDGRELFYQSPDGRKLLAVSVHDDGGLRFGEPHVLFEGPYLTSLDNGLSYAASPDGRRFLMTRQPNVYPLRASELVVVQSWLEEARRLIAEAK